MPIYEYKCDECDHRLEKLQKISDDPIKACPECGEDGLRKLVSAAAFKLKGTGWYETDFKDKTPKKDEKTSTNKKKDTNATSDTEKKPTKTETKKESKAATDSSTTKAKNA
ncbi:MAG: zinc ribbon domain-containing protein [Proteobacteria bacterium]|nr:zinc ribbon domain-containing protein [Pseudomonadota bacterium]NOG60766.1 zinc ribbon domain-containing protein [Pseudomonadota bacterium]